MRKNLLIAIGMLALTATTAARAQKPDVDADLRCMALISAMISQMEPDKQGNLIAGVMYFVGHVDGIAPNIDLKVELRRVAEAMTGEIAASEGQRCGKILMDKGQKLQEVGAALQAPK